MLAEALEHLVRGIVDSPEDVKVSSKNNRRGDTLEVRVHQDDLGRVIGRQGRTATFVAEHHHERLSGLKQDLLLADPGPELMFDDRVYKRGALTLHALRVTVGDKKFFSVLRTWVEDHTGGSVTTADFEACVAEVTGSSRAPCARSVASTIPPSCPARRSGGPLRFPAAATG